MIAFNYYYYIFISNDSDTSFEFELTAIGSLVTLYDTENLRWWNSTHELWLSGGSNNDKQLFYLIDGNNLIFKGVGIPLPGLAEADICVRTYYNGESPSWYYEDLTGGGGIPSFTWLQLFSSLFTLVGIVLLIRKQKISF